jgi:hypothetical protein
MRRRVRAALILRSAPDRFGRRVSAKTASLVEGKAEIVGERRLTRVFGTVDAPFAGDVRWPCSTALSGDTKIDGKYDSKRDEQDR